MINRFDSSSPRFSENVGRNESCPFPSPSPFAKERTLNFNSYAHLSFVFQFSEFLRCFSFTLADDSELTIDLPATTAADITKFTMTYPCSGGLSRERVACSHKYIY